MARPPVHDPDPDYAFLRDRHESERRKLYENEAFAITVFQAVSAASAFGIVSQIRTLYRLAGPTPVLISLTVVIFALISAVLGALWRHQYVMWGVKAVASGSRNRSEEAKERSGWADSNLWRMRYAMIASAMLLVGALLFLVGAIWFHHLDL